MFISDLFSDVCLHTIIPAAIALSEEINVIKFIFDFGRIIYKTKNSGAIFVTLTEIGNLFI